MQPQSNHCSPNTRDLDPPPYSAATEVVESVEKSVVKPLRLKQQRNDRSQKQDAIGSETPMHLEDIDDDLYDDLEYYINESPSYMISTAEPFLINPYELPAPTQVRQSLPPPVQPPRVLYSGIYATIYEHICGSLPSTVYIRRWQLLQHADRLNGGSKHKRMPGCHWNGYGHSPLRTSLRASDLEDTQETDRSGGNGRFASSSSPPSAFSQKLEQAVRSVWSRIVYDVADEEEEEFFTYEGRHTRESSLEDQPLRPSTPRPWSTIDTTHTKSAVRSLYEEACLSEDGAWVYDYDLLSREKCPLGTTEIETMLDISCISS